MPVGARAEEQVAASQHAQPFEHRPQKILRQIGIRDESRASEPGAARLQERSGSGNGNDGIGLDGQFDGCQTLGANPALETAGHFLSDGRQGDFAAEVDGTPQGQFARFPLLGVALGRQRRQFEPAAHEQEEILRPDGRPSHDRIEYIEGRHLAGGMERRGHGFIRSARGSFPTGSTRKTSQWWGRTATPIPTAGAAKAASPGAH